MLPQQPGVPREPGVPEDPHTLPALQASQAPGARKTLQALLELYPAPPAEATQPLLAAAIKSAKAVLALAERKSDTILLRAGAGDHGMLLVLKVYDEAHPGQGGSVGRAGREADALLRLAQAGVCVPGLIASGERALLRRYVEGPIVRDLHWDVALACQLAEWVFRCHAALAVDMVDTAETAGADAHGIGRSWLVGDMNLGNFVLDVASGRLCGIDLGDTRVGDPMDDVGEGCMRIIGRRPGFTADRWECAVAFASCYGRLAGSVEYVLSEVPMRASASFRQMAVWRSDPFMAEVADVFPFLWDEALLSWARAKQQEPSGR